MSSTGRGRLPGARNTGIAIATSEIVAFLDDDAAADETFYVGVGHGGASPGPGFGRWRSLPAWRPRRPGWSSDASPPYAGGAGSRTPPYFGTPTGNYEA